MTRPLPLSAKGRPLCLVCGKELAPRFEIVLDPNVVDGHFLPYRARFRPVRLKAYGDHGGFFHSGACAEVFAVSVARKLYGDDPLAWTPTAVRERELDAARKRQVDEVKLAERRRREREREDAAERAGLEEAGT